MLKRTVSILKTIRGQVLSVTPCDSGQLFRKRRELKYKIIFLETFLEANTFLAMVFMNLKIYKARICKQRK